MDAYLLSFVFSANSPNYVPDLSVLTCLFPIIYEKSLSLNVLSSRSSNIVGTGRYLRISKGEFFIIVFFLIKPFYEVSLNLTSD